MLNIASSASADNDRGIIFQILHGLGVTRARAHSVQVLAVGPLRILLILVIAFVITRLFNKISRRLVGGLRLVSPLVKASQRGEDRIRTLAGVFSSFFRALIWIIAFVTVLGQLNVNLTAFVATATVVGAAVGFGAQTLVKDFLSGILILAEDQYGVGDNIVVGSGASATSGTVESVNLRVTRVRGLDGVVWYVPNGDIRTVGNNTENDSQAVVDILVPYGTDLVAAGASAEAAARDMASEQAWQGVFVGQPTFAGVQSSAEQGVIIRVMAWTRPGQHFRASREMRLRILERVRSDGGVWTTPDG